MSVDDEVWTIEVTPARFGWHAVALKENLRLGHPVEGFDGMPIWRPTRRWAERAIERIVRGYFRWKAAEDKRAARARVYRFQG